MGHRIIWKFFGAFAFLTLITVLVLNFFVSVKLSDSFEQKITRELHSNVILVSDILKTDLLEGQQKNIQKRAQVYAEKLDLRVTIIDKQGTVLADSDKDPSLMENHKDRPEVIMAMETGSGQSTRPSETLGYNMKYVAVSVKDGDQVIAIVRFALPLSEVQLQIHLIYRVVLLGAIAAALIALTVAYFISRSITSPIAQMKETAQRIAKGNFSKKVVVKSKDELGELAKSLNVMSDELQQKIENLKYMDRMKTDFVANVTHELKTPLTLIKGYIETLEDKAIDDREKAYKFVSIIKEHTNRLENIINDLLSLSELELSKESITKVEFDLKDLIDDVSLSFGHALSAKKQSLSLSSQGSDFKIQADPDKIEQVFVNLIDNAIKYSGEAGSIKVSLLEQHNEIIITVEDKGVGIPKDHIDRVFERFYRVDKARSRQLGGTGLGLSIAKHIVLAHKGEISIESQINTGTTVSVILPRA